jgi:hypothetical protein
MGDPAMSSTGSNDAASKVLTPAIILIVVAAIGILGDLYMVVSTLLTGQVAKEQMEAQMKAQNPNMPPDQAEMMTKMTGYVTKAGVPAYIILLLIHAVILFGAIRMMKLRSYGLAMTSSVLGTIPCLSPCCVVGIPFGIWGLIVLMKPEVKQAFQ